MALDKEFFDSINIDLVKKKYYNANKVRALLDEIRTQAEALNAENAKLRAELDSFTGKRTEIGDAMLTAQAAAKSIIERANLDAAQIISQAQENSGNIGIAVQEHAVECVERCFTELKRQQMDNIETLNNRWQDFLCGLMPDNGKAQDAPRLATEPKTKPAASAPAPVKAPRPLPAKAEPVDESKNRVPPDLEDRVSAIAKELREIIGRE